ncbi:hypothetical protein ABZ348_04950 [Streptomyces sp. NPDC005963]|uniref:hypothetical protein n=1 Tax=Streptomyces sp. NPDC005963 TaxID=3156721 RepID=UPI0033DD64EE
MARTTGPARWQRVQTLQPPRAHSQPRPQPDPRPLGPPHEEIPIYEQLAQEWAAAGRTLPGVPDLEWVRLIQFPVRPPVPPGHGPAPAPHRSWFQSRPPY